MCQSRAIDLLRKMKADAVRVARGPAGRVTYARDAPDDFDAEEGTASARPLLLRLAEEVQDAVRQRVDERTWQVFWKIAVLGQSVRPGFRSDPGISFYAAFAARKRVGRMLREEGQRLIRTHGGVRGPGWTVRRLIEPFNTLA